MRLHQTPVSRLAERLERNRLLGPRRRGRRIAQTQTRVDQTAECATTDVGEFTPPFLHPVSLLTGQEGAPRQRRGAHGRRFRLLKIVGRLCLLRRVHSSQDVDPRSFRQVESIAAERAGQLDCTVGTELGKERAKLAREHGQRLVPARGRRLLPQRLGELIARHRPGLLEHQVGEEEPTLPPREAVLADNHAVGLDGDSTCEKNSQLQAS